MTTRDVRGSIGHIWRVYRSKGIRHVVISGVEKVMASTLMLRAQYRYYRTFLSRRKFSYKGFSYRYFYHRYNNTWRNERSVEIPVLWKIVQEHAGKTILEIGNVLSHYFPVNHEIVDKYEKGPGVVNEDVVDFRSAKRYDLIVSISTLEHVGWDEDPVAKDKILAEPTKILRAISNLRDHLSPGGTLVITVPLGLNPQLDNALREGRISFDERRCLRRVSAGNKWKETDWDSCIGARYGHPFKFANVVVFGVLKGNGGR